MAKGTQSRKTQEENIDETPEIEVVFVV